MTGPAGAETATIQATIDGREVTVPAGTTILDAARDLGIDIPTLCHHETLSPAASCRLCVVEVEGRPNLMPACATRARSTAWSSRPSPRPWSRRASSSSTCSSPTTRRAASPASSRAAAPCRTTATATASRRAASRASKRQLPIESDNPMIERDMNKCILCGKCVRVCARGAGHRRHRLHRARLRVADRRLVRQAARHRLLPLLRPVRRHLPHRSHRQQAAQGRAHLGPREGAHHLPLLRRRLQLRPQRRRRQGRRRHRRLRRAGQPGLAVRQGPLPHRPHLQPGPHHHAADQEGRRAGRTRPGTRPSSWSPSGCSRSAASTATSPSASSARRAAPTRRTTCCSASRGRASTRTASITAPVPDTLQRSPVWRPRWVQAR